MNSVFTVDLAAPKPLSRLQIQELTQVDLRKRVQNLEQNVLKRRILSDIAD